MTIVGVDPRERASSRTPHTPWRAPVVLLKRNGKKVILNQAFYWPRRGKLSNLGRSMPVVSRVLLSAAVQIHPSRVGRRSGAEHGFGSGAAPRGAPWCGECATRQTPG